MNMKNKNIFLIVGLSLIVIAVIVGGIVNLNIKQIALINWIGSSTFAIYLIHMHPFMMKYLFKELFILENWVNSWWLPVYIIGVTSIIMGACVLIDKVRIGLFTGITRMSDALRKSKMISAL